MEIKSRHIIIGDIHGCIQEFNELIEKLNYNPDYDKLILVGDLVDRGPDSVAVVAQAREMKLECCIGNHEYKFLKWFRSQGSRADVYDRQGYYKNLSDEDIQYIANMPTYIELEDVIVVHAGLKPGILLSNQSKNDLMYLRYTDKQRNFVSLKKINALGKEAAGAIFWTEFGPFDKNVVYGHEVHSMTDVRIDRFADGTTCYGIDTGCCFGGMLSALIWETKEIIQVKAKKVYFQHNYEVR